MIRLSFTGAASVLQSWRLLLQSAKAKLPDNLRRQLQERRRFYRPPGRRR